MKLAEKSNLFEELLNKEKLDYSKKFDSKEGRAKRKVSQEEFIDLHGLNSERAKERVETSLKSNKFTNRRKVVIMCGKGIHSENGPVLIGEIEKILNSMKSYFKKYVYDENGKYTIYLR